MHNQKKFRKYLKNGGDILLLIVSFLAGVFLAKRHAGMATGFIRLAAWEMYLLLVFCLAWNFGARVFGLYDEFYNRSLRIEMIALGENILLQVFLVVAHPVCDQVADPLAFFRVHLLYPAFGPADPLENISKIAFLLAAENRTQPQPHPGHRQRRVGQEFCRYRHSQPSSGLSA